MRNNWLFFIDLDRGSPYVLPMEPFLSNGFRVHLLSQLSSFVDSSLYHSRNLHVSGSKAFREAYSHISKLAGALLFWFSSTSTSNLSREILGNQHVSGPQSSKSSTQVKQFPGHGPKITGFRIPGSQGEFSIPLDFGKISSYAIGCLFREAERLQPFSVLTLAAALVPPFDNLSPKLLSLPLENAQVLMREGKEQRPCEVRNQGYGNLSFPELNWTRHAIEPRTGIEFPMILDNILDEQNKSKLGSELLVGTGSRAMTIIKIKSLQVYAFGFYIHPYSVCEKLGPKYASIPLGELNKSHDFYQDLLREDIGMTLRLVVNCNGMKVNSVKDAFEKSLRARLVKANPDSDFHCLTTFGSYFKKDIPLPAGTIIDIRRTVDGKLITEIGGNQMGVVRSRDLCRAFFDMYIGDSPVSEQTKEEIGKNVAGIIRRC